MPEEDFEEMDSAESSHLTAKPFNMPRYPNNTFQMKPLTEPDAEELPPTRNPSEVGDVDTRDPESNGGSEPKFHGTYPGSIPEIPFGVGPTPDLPDVNVYQHKKTVAQGMMDIALLSANANQLRYVLESGGNHPYYYASLTLIGISLLLQVVVGVGLILNSRYNVSYETSMRKANRINNYTVLAIFLITVMNVFISAFGIATVNTNAGSFPVSPRLQEEGTEVELKA